jgi:hypothetical protein
VRDRRALAVASRIVALKTWQAGDHEVIEVVVRRYYVPYDKMLLSGPTGRTSRWTVISAEQGPHGWLVTAMRCLPGCTEHHRKR